MNTYRLIPRIFRDRSISTNWVQIPLKQSRQVVHETVGCSNKNKTWQDWWHISHDTIDLFRRRMVTNGKGSSPLRFLFAKPAITEQWGAKTIFNQMIVKRKVKHISSNLPKLLIKTFVWENEVAQLTFFWFEYYSQLWFSLCFQQVYLFSAVFNLSDRSSNQTCFCLSTSS